MTDNSQDRFPEHVHLGSYLLGLMAKGVQPNETGIKYTRNSLVSAKLRELEKRVSNARDLMDAQGMVAYARHELCGPEAQEDGDGTDQDIYETMPPGPER